MTNNSYVIDFRVLFFTTHKIRNVTFHQILNKYEEILTLE
jgi:hypothetical protein